MIKKFVKKFEEKKEVLKAIFREEHPDSYLEIVKNLVKTIAEGENEYDTMNPEHIYEIDDGDYQGTKLYIISAGGYPPNIYYTTNTYYGSCPGCDTLQSIRCYSNNKPTKEQVKDYMTLALHLVQKLKEI